MADPNPWSIESFCALQKQQAVLDHHETNQVFLAKLGLPFLHPFCGNSSVVSDHWLQQNGIPSMGPAEFDLLELHDGSVWSTLATLWHMNVPKLVAFFSLWFLLFAPLCALGCLYLMISSGEENRRTIKRLKQRPTVSPTCVSMACVLTVASSLVMMTDTMYVQDFGAGYGTTMFFMSSSLAFRACLRYRLRKALTCLLILWLAALALQLTQMDEPPTSLVEEGLYYNSRNPVVERVVSLWDSRYCKYSAAHGATRWMTTGDVRTGLPFFLNKVPTKPHWVRVWLPSSHDEEVVALDISFPSTGHDDSKPVYFILHGLSGGSVEGYLLDLTMRRNQEGSTVVVMVSRGMMDTPLQSWNFFHGARLSDAHDAAMAFRKALGPDQLLVGVGYSMGGIVLNNYVAAYGKTCALDAAFSISGALDCRFQISQERSKRLWQPMLQDGLKQRSLLRKHGKKVFARLKKWEFIELLRASSVIDVDRWVAVGYHGYESIEHFYAEMSALGDIPFEDYGKNSSLIFAGRKISNISIPLCVLHAMDDPISSWRTVAAPYGPMRPDQLVQSGSGNLIMMLTKAGGHVGWPLGWLSPLGWFSPRRNWEFMSEAVAGFTEAVRKAKQEEKDQECTTY